ncbi:MAG TPA: hypothetical protein VMW58_04930 [Anaerolineae bacterium]|nr:hypothetical protein [Anaerolineae bacterium]
MDHDDLVKQGEELAEGKKVPELAKMAFVYAYVGNHELAMVIERLSALSRLVWGILLALVLALGSAVIAMIFKTLAG